MTPKLSEADLMLLRCMRNQHVSVGMLQKKNKKQKNRNILFVRFCHFPRNYFYSVLFFF